MQAEIIMIGTELLLGQIVDTNAAFMGRVLAENGINLFQKTTVGDNTDRIVRAIEGALERADVVLISGGLGPTEDDITRECVARVCGQPLEYRQELYDGLAEWFVRSGRPITENNRRQAYAPRGAISVKNPKGTAPGLIVEDPRGVIVCMPGVPIELETMLMEGILPYLREKFGLQGVLRYRVLKVCGMGESRVDAAIGDLIVSSENPKIGLLASPEAVQIRISAHAEDQESAEGLIEGMDRRIRDRLPGWVMGVDEETLEGVVARLLAERGWNVALAETHTGGMICQRLLSSGTERVKAGSILGTPEGGPANPAVAERMAEAARSAHEADCGMAAVADVSGGVAHCCFITPQAPGTWEVRFAGIDGRNQLRSTVTCLENMRRHLLGLPLL